MADFKISRFKYTWKGVWNAHSKYNPDDFVSFGGKVYNCIESHASNADFYYDLNYYNSDIPPVLSPKWELVADGTSWMGSWTNDVYYKVGDIVSVGGITYVCTEAHTSKFPELETANLESGFEIDSGKWTTYISSTNWRTNWSIGTYYRINDIVLYGAKVYRCVLSHTSAGTIVEGLEASQSSWEEVVISQAWRDSWSTNTRYRFGDMIKYGGNVYICQIPHVSAETTTLGLPRDQGKWTLLHESTEYKSDWQSSTIYKVNDIVKYGAYLYITNEFHTSESTFASDKFDIYCPGNEYDLQWDTTTLYQTGDIVSYGGHLYKSTTIHTNQEPPFSPNNWVLLYTGLKMRGDWNQATEYLLGDVVRRGGNVYSCLLDNVNQDPDFLDDNSTTNSVYWDLLTTGIKWRGVWAPDTTYIAGDTVVWVSSTYTCLDKHFSDNGNRPDDDGLVDSSLLGRYWKKVTDGNRINRLKNVGDVRTFGDTGDGSTIGYKALPVDQEGQALTAYNSEVAWKYLLNSENIFFVSPEGIDGPNRGTSPQSAWRSIRYATENVPIHSTIFIRTGDYPEILPITVQPYVALVGDDIRSVTVFPADTPFSSDYISLILSALEYLQPLISRIALGVAVGETIVDQVDVPLYNTEISQDFTASAAENLQIVSLTTLIEMLKNRIETQYTVSISSTNTVSPVAGNVNANAQIENNYEFIKAQVTGYVQETNPSLMPLPTNWEFDIERIIDALAYDILYTGNYKTVAASTFFINGSDFTANKLSNMFYCRDAAGIRNMTMRGLEGTLGAANVYGTSRPTAGAFVSLDPGWGPSDQSAWVGTRSPYIQNCTTFGTGCVGFKIDGNLHSGGNQTMVSNDFTQVISDGIGVWANGEGRTECISVFTYYNYIGYLATNGGKIRAANGNCSYGVLGAVSEGYNISETPITATVNNRYYDADVYQTLINDGGGLQKIFFSNAGVEYSSGTFTITGSGINATVEVDEFRNGGVQEIRIANPGDSSAEGGLGYKFVTNSSQGGNTVSIQLAGSDIETAEVYRGLRLVIGRGTGTGQYGYIADFDETGKYAYIAKESTSSIAVTGTSSSGMRVTVGSSSTLSVNDPIMFVGTTTGNIEPLTIYYVKTIVDSTHITISDTAGPGATFNLVNSSGTMTLHQLGWEHLDEGQAIEPTLDKSTNYYIEPRVTLSSPGFTSSAKTLPANRQWSSIAASDEIAVTVALDTNSVAYTTDNGVTWDTTTLPSSALWTRVRYLNGIFMAFASNGSAASSTDGINWSSMTMPSTAEWRDVTYGNGKWVAVAAGGTKAAYSTNGSTWTASTLPEGADWNSVAYGKGKYVTTALSDSTSAASAYSSDAITWTLGSITQGSYSLAYGNGRFVALSGGYAGATEVSISWDGITWTEKTIQAQDWREITYAQGIFFAVANGTTVCATSRDGALWNYQSLGTASPWCSVAYSANTKPGKWLVLAGLTANSTIVRAVQTGATARARAYVVAGRMTAITIWEPGSGYTSAPVMTIVDPNADTDVFVQIRTGNGVLGNPSILNAGEGYETTSTRVTVSGNGYKDQYQIGGYLVVDGLDRIPSPGDNVNISGINDYTYKLLRAIVLGGSTGNYTAQLEIAKDLGREESPEHGTGVTIRQLYSQCRITGHDFLEIGLGNYYQTNYPDTLNPNDTVISPENQVYEANGGRVFYTSTDEEGNFRCGELFAVEQSTGTVTLNAQFFQLEGLEEIRIGGVSVGGSGTVIREFSTDRTFIADSNNIVPTQRAIKAYLTARVSGGGSDATTGSLTAGTVIVGPDLLGTTTGDALIFGSQVNFTGGVDGTLLALNYFTKS